MAVEAILGEATFILLLGASLASLTHILRLARRKEKLTSDFTAILSVFILGWFLMEMFTAVSPTGFKDVVHFAHLLVLVAFAVTLTFRWRWALREASTPGSDVS